MKSKICERLIRNDVAPCTYKLMFQRDTILFVSIFSSMLQWVIEVSIIKEKIEITSCKWEDKNKDNYVSLKQ